VPLIAITTSTTTASATATTTERSTARRRCRRAALKRRRSERSTDRTPSSLAKRESDLNGREHPFGRRQLRGRLLLVFQWTLRLAADAGESKGGS